MGLGNSLGFRFVLPHASVGIAHAELGRRRFSRATSVLARAEAEARACSDVHNLVECEMVRIRIILALGAPLEALRSSRRQPRRPASPAQEGELNAVKAIAAACVGDLGALEAFLSLAGEGRWGTQAIVLCACGNLIAELSRTDDASDCARHVVDAVISSGWIDPLITACRACPTIVPLFAVDPSLAPTLRAAFEEPRL